MVRPAQRMELIPPYLFREIAELKRQLLLDGQDVIDLGIGDPDQPTQPGIVTALAEAAHDPATHRYDETSAGCAEYVHAAAAWFQRRFGVAVHADSEVLLLIGSKEGLAHIAWTFIDSGAVSLVPDPAYPVYRMNTLLAGGAVHEMPLLLENAFLPDLTAIPTDVAMRAKLLWLNYPNNPTCATASLRFYSDVVAYAKDYDLLIVSDAAYSEVYFGEEQPPSVLQVAGAKEVAVEFHSLSKSLNMAGWRLGFAVGNPDALAALSKLKSNIDSKQFAAISRSGAFALSGGRDAATMDLYRRRRDILCDGLNRAGWSVVKPNATFYVWAAVPSGETSSEFARRLLRDAAVLVIPGEGYGDHGAGYVRMSLTVHGDQRGERLAQAAERIGRCLR